MQSSDNTPPNSPRHLDDLDILLAPDAVSNAQVDSGDEIVGEEKVGLVREPNLRHIYHTRQYATDFSAQLREDPALFLLDEEGMDAVALTDTALARDEAVEEQLKRYAALEACYFEQRPPEYFDYLRWQGASETELKEYMDAQYRAKEEVERLAQMESAANALVSMRATYTPSANNAQQSNVPALLEENSMQENQPQSCLNRPKT